MKSPTKSGYYHTNKGWAYFDLFAGEFTSAEFGENGIIEYYPTNDGLSETPLFYHQNMDEKNAEDALEFLQRDGLVAIVDEAHGGIIGYVTNEHADKLIERLNR